MHEIDIEGPHHHPPSLFTSTLKSTKLPK